MDSTKGNEMVHARTRRTSQMTLHVARLLSSCRLTFSVLMLFAQTCFVVANEDKLEEQVDAVVSQMETFRKRLVNQLETEKDKLKKANVNPEAKRALIRAVETEVDEFKRTGMPPDHPNLIGYAVKFGEITSKTIQQAEALRLKVIDTEVRGDSPLSKSELKSLESRLENVLAGAVSWKVNDKWGGKRTYSNGDSQTLELRIHTVEGNNFAGILAQRSQNGTTDEMNVTGKRVGLQFVMTTTAMKQGKARNLQFSGVAIGNRILAGVSGIASNGKPASGFVKLFK